jgi:glycosyltransferase involved in cell wall biosynthesis
MVKILHVSAAGERGGLEVVLLSILKGLDRSRFLPQVLLLEDGPFVRDVEHTGTEARVIKAGRVREIWKGWRAVTKIVQLIRAQGIHVVHSHNAKAHIYGGLAAAIAGVPSLYHLHGVPRLTFSRDGMVSLLSVAVPARRTVACSAYVADAFRRAWHSRRKLLVIHNGVLLGGSTVRNARTVRQELGIPEGAPVIVMATRLQRGKGVHVFLEAAARVVTDHPEACFMIVGGTLFGLDKDYALELRQQVDRLSLSPAVRFLGFQPDVFRFLSAADIAVHSSIEPEPFGMALVEAMACSKPVIASDAGGPREIIENGVTGLLVPPKDAEHLAQAILNLLDDPDRRIRMGQAGAARVRDRFSAERMVRQLQGLYEGMKLDPPSEPLTTAASRSLHNVRE